jgi:hypothetical protein
MAFLLSRLFSVAHTAGMATISFAMAHPKISLGVTTTGAVLAAVVGPKELVRMPLNTFGFGRDGVTRGKCILNEIMNLRNKAPNVM